MSVTSKKSRRWIWPFIWLMLISGSSYAGYWYFNQSDVSAPQALIGQVKRGTIERTIVATGTLEPKRYVEVGAQVSGLVEKIYVEEGQKVEAGELLVEIDATVFETNLQQAEASLESKKAQLVQLEAELELAELRAKRNQTLYQQQAVSEDTLVSSTTNVKVLKSKIQTSIAQIKADEAGIAGDRARLGYAKIYGPISGTVATIEVRVGQTLNANQNAPLLLQISDLSTMTLRAEVSEADVTKLSKGMSVYFSTLGNTEKHWHTQVRQVLPTPTVVNDVVLYQALMDIENQGGQLMDSMTTQVFFIVDKADDTLIVPLSAVRETPKGTFALLPSTGDKPERVKVTTGVKTRTEIEILSGLEIGQDVIIGQKRAIAGNPGKSLPRRGRF